MHAYSAFSSCIGGKKWVTHGGRGTSIRKRGEEMTIRLRVGVFSVSVSNAVMSVLHTSE